MTESLHAPRRAERADSAANRRRILGAAREAFAARGLDVEMREVAQRAGVGVGTLYRHFDNRERLLDALLEETKDELLRRIEDAVHTERPASALRAMIRASIETYGQFGALAEAVLAHRGVRSREGHAEFVALIEEVLRRGAAEGVFRADLDVPLAAATLESLFISGALLELARDGGYAGLAQRISDFFLLAVRPLSSTSP